MELSSAGQIYCEWFKNGRDFVLIVKEWSPEVFFVFLNPGEGLCPSIYLFLF